jgi:hypothetical protein
MYYKAKVGQIYKNENTGALLLVIGTEERRKDVFSLETLWHPTASQIGSQIDQWALSRKMYTLVS